MLYLVTGANGSAKTLLTLKDVKDLADKDGRPVCYNGRFDLVEDGPLRNWRRIDAKDWQAEPDGTIFFFDECHNDFPVRPASAPVPEYVRMLAEHRKRGFDFFLITQHPQNIDAFVRRLIGNPGWHRHHKRQAGTSLVSVNQWDAVNPQCERPGSGESGQVTMRAFPREVYSWYRSAELHTAKVRIPKAVWILLLCLVLVPALGWLAYSKLAARAQPLNLAKPGDGKAVPGASQSAAPGGPVEKRPLTATEYIAARMPRVAGMPFSAPAYDDVAKPVTAPYPAACVHQVKSDKCSCFSQQATRLDVPADTCKQIANSGIFLDWQAAQVPVSASAKAQPLPKEKEGPAPAVIPDSPAQPMLSAPTANPPVFRDSVHAGFVGALSPRQVADAEILRGMR